MFLVVDNSIFQMKNFSSAQFLKMVGYGDGNGYHFQWKWLGLTCKNLGEPISTL